MKPEKVTQLDWGEILTRLERIDWAIRHRARNREQTAVRLWGVPRGGQVVVGLLMARCGSYVPAESAETCDVIVDDVIDSGATKRRYRGKQPFFALVDKDSVGDNELGWVEFPWEEGETEQTGEDAVARLMEFLGLDLTDPSLKETPQRVYAALRELTSGFGQDPEDHVKVFRAPNPKERPDQMIVCRDIPFWSLCEHHLLPFHGELTIGYLPSQGRILGLSKLGRIAEVFARRVQIQERLTQQIAAAIMGAKELSPLGVGVVIRAHHTCMAMRGVRTPAEMVTSALLGAFREPEVRAEFLALARAGG